MRPPRYLGDIRGERHPAAKLTEPKIREAWAMRAREMTYAQIASSLGVSETAVGDVFRRRTWKHVDP